MDVVKRTIAALGGRVEIESAAGRGTTVRVRLPLTLAIMDAMTLRVGDECYVLPLAAVVESLHRDAALLRTIGGRAEVLALRDEVLPVLCLATQFGVAGAAAGPILVIVESEGRRVALRVHELLGQQQVVVKNLETHFMRVDRLSGATILGDGRVALILDVDALVRGAGPAAADAPQLALEPAA
jgi:two-component system chemotaxis sensor kinase CheA